MMIVPAIDWPFSKSLESTSKSTKFKVLPHCSGYLTLISLIRFLPTFLRASNLRIVWKPRFGNLRPVLAGPYKTNMAADDLFGIIKHPGKLYSYLTSHSERISIDKKISDIFPFTFDSYMRSKIRFNMIWEVLSPSTYALTWLAAIFCMDRTWTERTICICCRLDLLHSNLSYVSDVLILSDC